ncbi:cytoplasmic protein [Fictibacillus macauensis ZFHKF-1]|uniref:Cytoplasmic protein n=1 Tax=Fictibacillus macauensis ZFHKF-1 TaxID=1196324 RepID=I8U9N7_9BACL|nr:immunity protein YezG family protein [Fictibacillus macauensis]EIT83670.1 cytoplasmic protein [Fictibacillus macauensis ZFHKF-1]
MSFEQEMNAMYQVIAEKVHEIIPVEWERFYFYGNITDDGGANYFFFNTVENPNNYIYSVDLLTKNMVPLNEYNDNDMQLYFLSKKLKDVFKKHKQELWYSFTMSVERSGKFKLHYDYTNWDVTEYDPSARLMLWEYKYLEVVPTDEDDKEVLDQYIQEYPHNPI